jgi:hypothetical protein
MAGGDGEDYHSLNYPLITLGLFFPNTLGPPVRLGKTTFVFVDTPSENVTQFVSEQVFPSSFLLVRELTGLK